MRRLLGAAAVLLLLASVVRADNLSDIRDWRSGTVPAAAVWNVTGFKYDWHIQQVQVGRRLIPSLILPASYQQTANGANSHVTVFAAQWQYSRDNALPLLLRMNNLAEPLCRSGNPPNYRLPLVPESIPNSPFVWWYNGGVLNDRPWADLFGPIAPWKQEGGLTATAALSQAVFAAHPSPAFALIVENNEAYIDSPYGYVVNAGTFNGFRKYTWRSAADLIALSLRMKERVDGAGYSSDPWDLWPELYTRRRLQYAAFFGAFRAASPAGWQNLTTGAYSAAFEPTRCPPPHVSTWIGHSPEAICYDGMGPELYPGFGTLPRELTSTIHKTRATENIPAWEWIESRNPKAYRELFVSMNFDDAVVPAQQGLHEVTSPDIFRAYCEWLAWLARKPGVPVLLHHWIDSVVKPNDLFFVDPYGPTALAALGRSDLATTTHQEYAIAPAKACDSICRPEVRDFWQSGVTVEASAPAGVHVVAVKLASKTLVYVWTPKALTGLLAVTVDGTERVLPESPAPSAYWVIETEETVRQLE